MLGPFDLARRRAANSQSAAARPATGFVEDLAADAALAEALRFFARERRWIDEQHLAVCRIPSPTFFEQQRAAWVAAQLADWGWDSRLDRAGNVVAQLKPAETERKAGKSRLVVLSAHLDTVLAPRNEDDIKFDGRDRISGPGVADNGAGLAGLLAIGRALTATPVPAQFQNVVLVANVGEEGEGNLSGMRFLCRQSPLAPQLHSVLVLDGPDTGHITCEALACRRFEVTLTGPGGHSWSDQGTANPIHALARAITWYGDARLAEAPRERPCSWNFGVIEGGATVNAIPASARVKVDLRAESATDLDELSASLSTIVESALLAENDRAASGRVTARIRETGARPGGRLSEDASILNYVKAVDQWLGIRAQLDCASTDANIPLSMGLPALSIGAGGQGGGAHTSAEWFSSEKRELGLRRALLVLALLAAEASAQAA